MGCDIHMYIEEWDTTNKKWSILAEDSYTGRDYDFFGIIAGVRGRRSPQLFEVKGFPDDASPEVKAEYDAWVGDSHTPSYILREEIEEVLDENIMFSSEVYLPKSQMKKLLHGISSGNPEWNILDENFQFAEDGDTKYLKIPYQYSTLAYFDNILGQMPIGARIVFWFDN